MYIILRDKLKKKTPAHIRNVFGFDLYQNTNDLDYSHYIDQDLLNIKSHQDSNVITAARFFLKPGDTAIDIGANIGFMSLIMSKFVGLEGTVVSIEPGPISFALLRRNVYANFGSAKNIMLVDAAYSDISDQLPLFINSQGESDNQVHKGLTSYEFRNEASRDVHFVKGIALDDEIGNLCNPNNVSFIKIDTQGHEWYVLNGSKNFISGKKDLAILCEFAPYLKSWEKIDLKDFFDLIRKLGFSVYDFKANEVCEANMEYITQNYGFDKVGKYTDLLLLKGKPHSDFLNNWVQKS